MVAPLGTAAGAWCVGDIFREVEEELRQERFEKLWQRYGKLVVGGAVAVILVVAGIKGWDHYRTAQRAAESAEFSTAVGLMSEGKNQDAAALFASLADNAGDGYATLARFNQATLRARSGDIAGAVAVYDAIARDGSVPEGLRGAATIHAAMHAMDAPDADAAALTAKLQPLIDGGGPWRHSAAELSALLALGSGDDARARTLIQKVADDVDAPARMRARATEILAVIGG
jgi:hypothetical protein